MFSFCSFQKNIICYSQSRNPPIVPLTLTLSEFPLPQEGLDSTPALHHVLSLIFPLVTTLPLSLDVLNNSLSRPESKDEDLHSGWLQLPRGSILILTESSVAEGSLFNQGNFPLDVMCIRSHHLSSYPGVMTIRAVQETMRHQTLEYIFPFSSYTFETDINFIVLANGKQSTFFEVIINAKGLFGKLTFDHLQTSLNIPLRLNISDTRSIYKSSANIKLPPPDKLAQFRQLVGGAKVGSVTIGEATGEVSFDLPHRLDFLIRCPARRRRLCERTSCHQQSAFHSR